MKSGKLNTGGTMVVPFFACRAHTFDEWLATSVHDHDYDWQHRDHLLVQLVVKESEIEARREVRKA
jgi:hypothetical protein